MDRNNALSWELERPLVPIGSLNTGYKIQKAKTTNFCVANVIAALVGSAIALAGTGWSLATGGVLILFASLWLWNGGPHCQLGSHFARAQVQGLHIHGPLAVYTMVF